MATGLLSGFDTERAQQGLLTAINSPLFHMGLGVLANNTGKPGAVGQGLLGGLSSYQEAQQAQAMNQYRQMMADKLKRETELEQQKNTWLESLPESERPYALLSPDQYVRGKFQTPKRKAVKIANPDGSSTYRWEDELVGKTLPAAPPAPITPYQQAQLDLQQRRLGLDEQQFGFQQQQAERKYSMPKPLSAEAAGRFAMANQAIDDIQGARDLMFDPDGSLNYQNLFAANVPGTAGLGSAGRELRSRIENAVASKLRIETGAAATESEVRNVAKRFMPTPMDTAESAADKLRRLEEFMQTTTSAMTGGRPPGNGLVGDQGLQMDLAGRRGGGPTFGGQQQNKPIRARNKQGQTLELRNGQWVPVQ